MKTPTAVAFLLVTAALANPHSHHKRHQQGGNDYYRGSNTVTAGGNGYSNQNSWEQWQDPRSSANYGSTRQSWSGVTSSCSSSSSLSASVSAVSSSTSSSSTATSSFSVSGAPISSGTTSTSTTSMSSSTRSSVSVSGTLSSTTSSGATVSSSTTSVLNRPTFTSSSSSSTSSVLNRPTFTSTSSSSSTTLVTSSTRSSVSASGVSSSTTSSSARTSSTSSVSSSTTSTSSLSSSSMTSVTSLASSSTTLGVPLTTSTTSTRSTTSSAGPTTSQSASLSSSSSSTSSSATQTTGPGGVPTGTVLQQHNLHRQNTSTAGVDPNIGWNDTLANAAAQLAATCNFAHDTSYGGGGYGQNIAGGTPAAQIATVITNEWYNDEINYFAGQYGKATPDLTNFDKWGHYTQVVWAGSTTVGCAVQYCANGWKNLPSDIPPYFTVCNYYPAGNVLGAFDTNVFAPGNAATVTA